MFQGSPVIDADSHKCENPLVFPDFVQPSLRRRLSFVRDRFGEQRIRIDDVDPATGRVGLRRLFPQPDGYGKGTFRPYHEETTLGGLFNRVRIEHMEREGIDHQILYGSVALGFGSIIDPELAAGLCRAYNDYIVADCHAYADRLHPVGVLPLQDPPEALAEMRRCIDELGMPAVSVPPNLPQPHPRAAKSFPDVRVPKHLSHPDFEPLWSEAERLRIAIGVHGAPGFQLAGGSSDQLDSFVLVHAFANRSLQQMAIARLIFDGVLEAHPRLRFAFLEAGAGWFPDFIQTLRERWEKRILRFDPGLEPRVPDFLLELARERSGPGFALLRKAKGLMGMLFTPSEQEVPPQELERFRYEHPALRRDPLESVQRGQILLTVEPDDPAPGYLPHAMGDVGRRICAMAVDYGHWDATLADCVSLSAASAVDEAHAAGLLGRNVLEFFGDRLRRRIGRGRESQWGAARHDPALRSVPRSL
jgi:predicted TIM-barrel fold metal-dependent hydrolase